MTGAQARKRISTALIAKVLSIVLVIFQVWAVFSGDIEPRIRMAVFLAIVLALVFLNVPVSKKLSGMKKKIGSISDMFFVVLCLLTAIYFIAETERLVTRWPQVDPLYYGDIIVGILLIVFTIEGTRRVLGNSLTVVGIVALLYIFLGHLIPGTFGHRPYDFTPTLDQLVFTTHALFSSPLAVATTYVFMFIIFGQFFGDSGAGVFFYKLAKAAGSKLVGGPAQIASIASALFGSINGSPASNALMTGSFTIPSMIKFGYSPVFAGAVEAAAGTGGAMLPPVMGTAAFLMVEMADIPYMNIIIAAAVPGILYYVVLMYSIYLRAKKINLIATRTPDHEAYESVGTVFLKGSHHFLPLVLLVILILMGLSLSLVAGISCLATIALSWSKKSTRIGFKGIIDGFVQCARASLMIGMACATAGVIVGALSLTGLGGKIAHVIISFSGSIPFLALFFTAVLCVILGMGMPVPAAYSLTAALAIPSLYPLGFQPLPTHLLVVYYSSLSAITPPVAVAAFATASISKASPNAIGWQACRLGLAGFILPIVFVYQPWLLLEGFSKAPLYSTFMILISVVGLLAVCNVFEGWLLSRLNLWQRAILVVSSILILVPSGIYITLLGGALFLGILIHQLLARRVQEKRELTKGIVLFTHRF
jgi:TRAP transporter 4TM/12TM fusion protein